MASGDVPNLPKYMTYAKSNVPIIGALIDYIATSIQYLQRKTSVGGEVLHPKASKATLSATFMSAVCFVLGIVCNIKLEVVTFGEVPMPYDLHIMLMSKENNLYVDDIDVSTNVHTIQCLLIWNTSNRSPLSEYLFLPWLGAALRGLFLRQAPTAGALLYTMAIVNGTVNPLFLTTFFFLFLFEARLWLEIARVVRARWERRNFNNGNSSRSMEYFVETLWSNDDVQSVEVGNFVY
ncbi:hypothetical protein K1T71_007366 [Dendrolimus kikuchii]|uniref:Uncharacterized protein n=1 Tax=Dendrolimus kikuchii TaxID=765133 RepID=A0ACC1D1F5_9NEOP|nr:hypothetical protein K1T71_007366 [Dendrolimus kikuchii]